MIVWRIQNKKGQGPYRNDTTYHAEWARRVHWNDTHPDPRLEDIVMEETFICGFRTLKQLKEWFDIYERIKLKDKGFNITKLKVSKKYVKLGKKQLAFNKEHATII